MPENTRLINLLGTFCSGRKVWNSSSRGWKVTSSGCTGAGCEGGRMRSNSRIERGSCSGEPMRRVSFKGFTSPEAVLGVGGRYRGGLEGFYFSARSVLPRNM